MSLDTALKNFADAFAAGSENIGAVHYQAPQPIIEPIPLGSILKDYYGRLCMTGRPQVGGTLYLALFTLDQLERAQHGWRWIRDKDGPATENPDWDPHWVVIADRDGDAIVVDDSTAAGTVFGNIGSKNFLVAEDIASFFQVMADAITLEAVTFDYDVCDDDFNNYPQFLDAIRGIARRALGPDGEVGFMKFFYG